MKRLLTMALIVGLCSSHSLFAASLTKQSVNFSGTPKNVGVVNDADNLVFLQAINPSKPGFITQGNGEWGFATNDGSNTPDVAAIALQFNGAPALLGIPAESGTLTIGANNEIADLWTQRIYARPVVFVSFEDPNLNNGVSIVPTAPITHGNQFLFDVRQTDGFGADLTGAKVHYLVAEEGWHRLADGRMLLISSAEVKHTGFTGKTIELGASFTDAVTVAQLQRPMLFKNSLGFRQLFDMEVYQGATVTSGVGDFDSIGLRLMQQNGVEATTSDTVYAGRIGFMVLGHISNIANKFKTVRDTNTNIRGGSYLTVPQANFQYYPHSAAATPLLNKAACAEDDDVQNFCTYLSLPVDAMSRGTFDTPRLPYMNSDFEPLQMQRTLYSEIEGSWEGTAEAELATPVTDGDGKAIVGTLARMYPNLVAARGWDAVLIGSNSYWHWFATYHYNTCVFDSMNTACVDYTPGETIVKNSSILWDASTVRYDPDDNKYIGAHPSTTRAQELFIATDTGRNDRGTYVERLTPKSWEASDTFDYLKFKVPDNNKFINLDNIQAASRELIETAAEPWQFAFIRTSASASESWCATCEGIPTFQTGAWKSSESKVYLVAVHSNAYYYGEGHANGSWIRPRVGKVGKSLRVGDYLFANIPIGVNVQDFYWLRSATGTRSDAVQIAYGELGYQATADDGNHYVTLCMDYDNSERCGDWFKVGNIPYATNIGVRTIAPTGVDLVGDYSYIAPGNGNYDVESRSPHRWQKLTNGVWQDISGETEQTYVARGSLGWQVRFCVIPRSLAGITGPEVCSAGIVVQGDNDSDGIADHWDSDDDNDGIFDWYDAFPMDRNEWVDTDRDGIGNNADLDDDNDGLSDEVENAGLTDPLKYDTDGDGTNDADDPFPTSYGNFPDFDNDGLDDTVDDDIDGDGVVDFVEITHNGQSVIRRVDDDPFRACVSNHITVTSNADSGPGSLRQALIDLCSGEIYSDLSIIDFSDAMTITLQSPLVINKGMEINGNREVILDAQGQHEVFHVAMKEGLASTQFPYLVGLTLRNGISTQLEENQIAADRSFGSAINVQSSPYVMLHTVFIENMTAPAIAGDSLQLYLENSLVANVQGNNAALVVKDGHIALFSSTIVNSEGGTISLVGEGKAQLRNSLLLKGANGSTVCNVEIWEQQSASWVEDSECGVISSGYVELADPDNGDYRPVPGSANIDAGENGELPPDAVDLLGNARVMGEYNPDYPPELGGPLYPKMDIGAIEYVFNGDFDGDGVDDNTDAFPSDPSETLDSDRDGVGDNSDAFPNDPNEQFDTDSDGIGNNTDEDDDGDQVADADDAFPLDGSEWLDSDADGIGNNADTDDDNDNVPDSSDAFPLNATESVDTDLDGIGNNADTDDDNDGVLDASDAFPLDATEAVDTDLDGIGNNADTDDDNDGVLDVADAFPLNASEWMDTDLDGIGNNADTDDDNDGVVDSDDAFPLDAAESLDTDLDGIGNNADTDDDNDGVLDSDDAFPLDATESVDTDLDGIGNNADTDDDNDGVVDTEDAFPLDAAESVDTDLDGIGNNADTDDDNDGVLDASDAFPLDATEAVDTDLDGIGNNADTDDDNDGVLDSDDAFPLDAAESLDTDLDGIGNNADTDDDNDGVLDSDDAFPLDATESVDTDLDGIGNNADTDDDNDGVLDSDDTFPLDAAETVDTDKDGIGNNADTDDDNDGVLDSDDAFPLDASETVDTDKDGIGNNADTDDDNDGVVDSDDAFPLDAAESVDTDKDGIGNNADTDDDNDGVLDTEDAFPLDAAESVDTDLDGIGNNADTDDDNDGIVDSDDAFPLDAAESVDTDLDGIGNNADTDDDNDGVLDSDDAFPLDAAESVDTDKDGIGNNADTDDDNDGVVDSDDAFPLDASEAVDTDKDGIGNNADTDDDNDGVVDSDDAFPLDAAESVDTDLDGIGNNADTDDDNDGVLDSDDAFPLDAAESLDTDLDGIGNNADTDDDNDGVVDSDDAFPLDATESVDTDLDGIGNNADTDDDNDGVLDSDDAFPLDASEAVDTDLDGIGNNADTDDDNDGVLDSDDAFPLDAAESVDTDLDGIGNNADTDDDNDGVLDSDDAFPLDASEAVDTDGDGIGNNADTDDDNDGIPDEEDTAPLDPNIGDTQKPVFAELAALTFEATGVMTAVTLPEPQVTDNISPTLTISSDLTSELALGEHKVVWTATDRAGNSATAEQWVTIVDTTAPEFEELSPLVINASGRLTDISPLLNYSAFDLVDGEVSAVHSGSSELVSGAHELELSATDSSGNTATAMLRLHILPRLKLAKTMTVEAGGSYSVPVQLSGEAPAYPVTMAYSLEVNGVTQPAQSASIASGTSGELMVSIPAGLALNTELLVRVNSISNAFVADDHLTELLLTEQNLAPTISVQVLQQGVPTRVLAPASGEAQIRLSISDVNVNDTHQINWQVLDLAFSGEISADGLTMSINSDELSQGRYAVDVTVTETNTPEQLSSKRRIRFNVAALAELSAATDTDGDGIVDSQEGYGDSDNDGIADYLDNDVDGSRLPVNSTTESMQTSAGVQLSLGNITSALISSGAGMTMTDLAESVANSSGAADSDDAHFSQVTAVLDFTLSGQIQPGQSVAVVFPLPRGAALPVDAVYRKYNTVQGWFNFVEDSRNSLGSAPLLDGECPAVGAASYEAGLVEGYQCVQLLLEDGGPNDADGNANGVIEDPGVIAILSQNQLPVANLDTASILDTQTLVIDVLANDSDADGDSLSVIAASADNGAVELLADNTLRFSPDSGFSGTAIIRYQVSDGFGGSAQGEVHVTVSLAPVVEPDTPATDTGGGSMPLWSLLLLGLAFTRYRRAAKPQ